MKETCELAASELRYTCDPTVFKFKNTAEIEPLDEVIGQERAVHAIDFGLNMTSPGYNIFVTGIEGTGRTTIVRDITAKHAQIAPHPLRLVHGQQLPRRIPPQGHTRAQRQCRPLQQTDEPPHSHAEKQTAQGF